MNIHACIFERNVGYNTIYANYLMNIHVISSDDGSGNKNN